MEKSPAPLPAAAARELPWRLGQSAEAFRGGAVRAPASPGIPTILPSGSSSTVP